MSKQEKGGKELQEKKSDKLISEVVVGFKTKNKEYFKGQAYETSCKFTFDHLKKTKRIK